MLFERGDRVSSCLGEGTIAGWRLGKYDMQYIVLHDDGMLSSHDMDSNSLSIIKTGTPKLPFSFREHIMRLFRKKE